MDNINSKKTFAKNLKKYMKISDKTQIDICNDLNFKPTTFSGWMNEVSYPRIDKIELLANYFNIKKSDLIEDKEINT